MLDRIFAISNSVRRRLLAAALLLPLVALATATGGFGLRCRVTGEVSSACCCDRGQNEAAKAEGATVSPADCCDRVIREATSTPAEANGPSRALPEQTAPVAYLAFEAPPADVVSSALSVRSETRASLGPPSVRLRLVSKSAFLI